MYAVEGRGADIEAAQNAVDVIRELVASTGRPVVWVWRPRRQVAFGPRDARHEGYEAAAAAARQRGFTPVERSVGGHPVAHTGRTLAFTRVMPVEDVRRGLTDRYNNTLVTIQDALDELGVPTERGEPPDSFCPGDHSLMAEGKIVGLAQRVASGVAAVSGVVVVADAAAVSAVLVPVYDALDLPFDPSSVGSIAEAGGPADGETVAAAIERALASDGAFERIRLEDLLDR